MCGASRAGKKTYTVLMGKPAPAKLANFPEVEVWVQVRLPLPLNSHHLLSICLAEDSFRGAASPLLRCAYEQLLAFWRSPSHSV